jgi:hypothetical protein
VGGCNGQPTVLASQQQFPQGGIAVDAKSVYWTNYANGNGDGSVMKVCK